MKLPMVIFLLCGHFQRLSRMVKKLAQSFQSTVLSVTKASHRVTIVAKVVEVSSMNFQLVTLKDFVKEL